ncbi:MAG: FKBP-type peptidyl-prolyl cis-trans isomerase [Akkermansiaceae bacterium]|nr:FKBP-type peptidyl-prolyl cis-trans isomerase [Akkermansiaceae bacterium]
MRKHTTAACLLLITMLSGLNAQEAKLETETDKASYLIGRNIGTSIKNDDLDLNIDNLVAGLQEALAGKESRISSEDEEKVMTAFQKQMQDKFAAREAAAGKENAAAGKEYLAENKKREGVKTTESGLQYEILKAGSGARPSATDTVSVHYHGTLIDGTVFDSSVERKEPATFGVNQVIPGWTEALQLMPTGSKWKLFIPAGLGYGAQGAGRDIGPNATLIFEVELLSIAPAK